MSRGPLFNLSANDLRRNALQSAEILDKVQRELDDIHTVIHEANENKSSYVTCKLPSKYSVDRVSSAIATRKIYCDIISTLEHKGFQCTIDIQPDKTTLVITWNAAYDGKECRDMDEYLTQHTESARLIRRHESHFRHHEKNDY